MGRSAGSGRGQASVELVGIMLVVAVLFGSLLAVTAPAGLAKLVATISGRLLCVVKASAGCRPPTSPLQAAYGTELAALVQRHAPEVRFEDGEFVSLPVDPRACRERRCADSSEPGRLGRSFDDYPATAFVHPIDCRGPAPEPAGADCSGARRGRLYIQYWLYYPESATRPLGGQGFHRDDWESFQVRIGPGRDVSARASSHHGYNHGADPISDLGRIGFGPIAVDARGPAWGPSSGFLWVSAGSHAGRVVGGSYTRSIPRGRLRLVPMEAELRRLSELEFAVEPPWLKPVWRDPEQLGT